MLPVATATADGRVEADDVGQQLLLLGVEAAATLRMRPYLYASIQIPLQAL